MANLNNLELYKAFGIGVHTAIAGGGLSLLAMLAQFINFSHVLTLGLYVCVVGISIAMAAMFFGMMNGLFQNPKIIEYERSERFVPGCWKCAYFHGLNEIHCAVHPHGKDFKDCKDYEIRETHIPRILR